MENIGINSEKKDLTRVLGEFERRRLKKIEATSTRDDPCSGAYVLQIKKFKAKLHYRGLGEEDPSIQLYFVDETERTQEWFYSSNPDYTQMLIEIYLTVKNRFLKAREKVDKRNYKRASKNKEILDQFLKK